MTDEFFERFEAVKRELGMPTVKEEEAFQRLKEREHY